MADCDCCRHGNGPITCNDRVDVHHTQLPDGRHISDYRIGSHRGNIYSGCDKIRTGERSVLQGHPHMVHGLYCYRYRISLYTKAYFRKTLRYEEDHCNYHGPSVTGSTW